MRAFALLSLAACEPTLGPPPDSDESADSDGPTETDVPAPFADLPKRTWSYVPIDGMTCGDGSPTGIGVNPGSDPERLLILVAGGGACWDGLTCYVLKSAVNVESSWGEPQLRAETGGFDRDDLAPLLSGAPEVDEATWIYVPYCTGDLHAGDKVQAYDPINPARKLHHHGDANWAAWIQRVQAELPLVRSLWVIGFSAGGYGAQFQAHKLGAAWPDAAGAVLADGAPLVTPYGGRLGEWRGAWDLHTPPGCTDCERSFPAYLADARARMPTWRFGLVTTDQDAVITVFASYPAGGLGPAVDSLVRTSYADDPQAAAFVKAGTEHVLLGSANTATSRGGVNLLTWFTGFIRGPAPADAP